MGYLLYPDTNSVLTTELLYTVCGGILSYELNNFHVDLYKVWFIRQEITYHPVDPKVYLTDLISCAGSTVTGGAATMAPTASALTRPMVLTP